jgi:phosphatidylglycerophosphate synthase
MPLSLSAMYSVKAVVGILLIAALAAAGRKRHHPFPRLGPANRVTALRAVFVSLIVACIGEAPSTSTAAAIVVVSLAVTVLDGFDGWLARRSGMASAFGARFDMEVDSLLILSLAILVWQYDRAGVWVVFSGLLRYLFVAAGWVLPWLQNPLPPSMRRQAICVVQVSGLIIAIAPIVPPDWARPVAAIALAALGYSFFVDVLWLVARSDRREQVA